MDNLRLFSTENEYDLAVEDFEYPTVAYVEGSNEVKWMTPPHDYSKDYLTFKALEDGTFTLTIPSQVDTNYLTSVSYSTDNGSTWVTTQNDATEKVITTPSITTGNTILWKGSGISTSITGDTPYVSKFSSTGAFDIEGNIMSMLYGDNFANQTTLPSNSTNFRSLFNGSDIVDASNLKLPATTLTVDCYRGMLGSCTSLTTMPDLPAMNLADSCYFSLFNGCSSLTNIVSQLPATTLANNCYRAMFQQCSSLTTIPTDLLPATTMMDSCYKNMFRDCTSLEIAPELPATTLATNCYYCMFYGCTSLTTAPELPATTLTNYCYQYMFKGCTSLTTAPELPATTLTYSCYANMFSGCTSLTTAPELPATTLTNYCYQYMFYGCTSLTTAPELPATTLTSRCYESMFQNCSNLNYIKAMFTTAPSTSYTRDWVQGVAATGTFVKNYQATWTTTGVNGVPTGWSVDVEASFPKNYDYFTTEAIDDSVFTFSIPSGIPTSTLNYVEYSVDNGQTWIKTNNVDSTAVTVTTPTIMAGNSVKWRCAARAISTSSDHSTFSSSGRYNVSGNVMSLVSGISKFSSVNALRRLFFNSTNLISAINLSLATTVASECYKQMFSGCTSLIAAPELPATTLIYNCYNGMFSGCTSLTTAPELPATTLANACYYQMFNGCTSLTTAPSILPATTLVSDCYNYMFQNCSTLNYIKAMFTTTPSTSYTRDWVNGVASSGTFVKNNAATWNETGVNGIPTGWTVETASE